MADKAQQKNIIWPDDVQQLSIEDLRNPRVFDQIQGMAIEFVNTGDIDESRKLLSVLSEKLKNTNEISFKRYDDVVRLAEIGSQKFATLKTQLNILANAPLFLIKNQIDPINFFSLGLTFSDISTDNNRVKALEAFENNNEKLGSQPIRSDNQSRRVEPTIANWIHDLHSVVRNAPSKSIDGYISYYLHTSTNYKKLNPEEQAFLKEIFGFYNWLLTPTPLFVLSEDESDRAPEAKIATIPPVVQPKVQPRAEKVEKKTEKKVMRDVIENTIPDKKIEKKEVVPPQEPIQETVEIPKSEVVKQVHEESILKDVLPLVEAAVDPEQFKGEMLHIMDEYDLHVDEGSAYKDEVVKVLQGTTHPSDFAKLLRKNIDTLPDEGFRDLIRDTNERIFKPVRNAVVENTHRKMGDSVTQKESSAQTQLSSIKERLEQPTHTPEKHSESEESTTQKAEKYGGGDPYRESVE